MDPRSPSPRRLLVGRLLLGLVVGSLIVTIPSNMSGQGSATGWKVVAWNNLGMHCMDADFGVFAILPPYNTIQAHVIDSAGELVPARRLSG